MSRDAPDTEVDGLFAIVKALDRVAEAIEAKATLEKKLAYQLREWLEPYLKQLVQQPEHKLRGCKR